MTDHSRFPLILLGLFIPFSLLVFGYTALVILGGSDNQTATENEDNSPLSAPELSQMTNRHFGSLSVPERPAEAEVDQVIQDEAVVIQDTGVPGQLDEALISVIESDRRSTSPEDFEPDLRIKGGLFAAGRDRLPQATEMNSAGLPTPSPNLVTPEAIADSITIVAVPPTQTPNSVPMSSLPASPETLDGSNQPSAPVSTIENSPAGTSASAQINGLPLSAFLIMPENVVANTRTIIDHGKQLGRNPRAYSKVGDSTIENPNFMTRFDSGPYNLGEYGYLQAVIDFYAGSHSRQGMAVRRGMHSWTVNDPAWADNQLCNPNETPIACEIRLHNPSIIFIRLGSNDSGSPGGFEQNLHQTIAFAIDQGVLPILGTKADRFEGSDINNQIIRRLATEFQVPLWDFDRVASTIPSRGLGSDGVHLTIYYAHDYTSPIAFQRGHGLHNLSALLVLDALWREFFVDGS